jgi:K+/H+ antiporter YhaU regulatory subunit KhtT
MNTNVKKTPVYIKIALDVASRIYNGDFQQGQKIKGRSTLASEYATSPETIRKAMSLLRDMGVVDIQQGSGIYVKSKKDAHNFLERFKSKEKLDELKKELKFLIEEKRQLDYRINEVTGKIIDFYERSRNTTSFNPIEIQIPLESHLIGKTLQDISFRNHTGGTIIGIKRGEQVIMSPGPSDVIEAEDTFVILADSIHLDAIYSYILKV